MKISITENPVKPGLGIRHLQSLLLTLCVMSGYLQRVNLSMAIVVIAKEEGVEIRETMKDGAREFPTYSWNNQVRSYLLSAFFVGYLIMNLPASIIGVHINNKQLLLVTFLINGILSCLTPFFITYEYHGSNDILKRIFSELGSGNWKALIILRGLQGLLQAFMFPTIHAIIARWAPPTERGRLGGFIMSGVPLGTMIILISSGILASSSLGWPSIFYASGMISLLWTAFWWIFGSNSPSEYKSISKIEFNYITSALATTPGSKEKSKKIPWKSIIASQPVWAIIVAHTGHNWGHWLLLSEMPSYIHSVLGFNIKQDGLLSAVPYLSMWLLQLPVMYIADNFNKRQITSLTTSRKLWNSIGFWGASVSLFILGYLDDNATAAITLYICAVTIGCCCNVGFNINHMDLSPHYAGVLMGLSNGVAATGGWGAPLIVAYFVTDIKSVFQWRMVFYFGTAVTFFSNLIFIIFGSGKIQPWNDFTRN